MDDEAQLVVAEFERVTVPDDVTRTALIGLLGAHAIPVWGWGQRGAYERLVMAGPDLDQWVRTAGLWAEMERMVWEWEQLVAGISDVAADQLVHDVVGELAPRTVAAAEHWVDLMLRAACVDALGEHAVRTVAESAYAPLRRHARTMVAFKRGQAADGLDSLRDVVRSSQLDFDAVRERLTVWRTLAREHAAVLSSEHDRLGWDRLGLASALDVDAALAAVDEHLDRYLKGMSR
jgi:hypothetical protein